MVGVEVLRHPDVSGIATAAWWSLGRPEEIRARRRLALPQDMEVRGLTSAATGDRFMERLLRFFVATCALEPAWIADCRLPIADCRLPIADCRLPIADCRLPIAD